MFVHKFCRFSNLPGNLRGCIATRNSSTQETAINGRLQSSSVDPKEIQHHETLASNWWDPSGPMRALHSMNSIRVPFIRDGLLATGETTPDKVKSSRPLDGFDILEVGCGGGFLTENLARLHAKVTGIDAGIEMIRAAEQHVCQKSPELLDRITYRAETIENHSRENPDRYDAVVLSEVVEHVDNPAQFVTACIDALKTGGSVFVTTPNRTVPMWLTGIILAENVFNLVPKGTHHYNKFITPLEMQRILDSLNCSTILINGFFYEFWRNTWRWVPTTEFSYALQAVKGKTS